MYNTYLIFLIYQLVFLFRVKCINCITQQKSDLFMFTIIDPNKG